MKAMKKIVALLLAMLMLFSVAACSADDGDGATTTTTTTTTTTPPPTGEDPDVKGHYVFVDPNGNDENDGAAQDRAVKTLERANAIASEYISSYSGDGENVVISLGAGEYRITEGFTPVSGNDYVNVYYLSRGGRAKILGGVNVAHVTQKCTNAELLAKIKDETARANIYEIDLSSYSANIPEFYNTQMGYNKIVSGIGLYLNGENLFPARWPNEGEVMPDNAAWVNGLHGYAIAPYLAYIYEGEFKTPTEINDMGSNLKRITPMAVYFLDSVMEHISEWDWTRGDIYTKDFFSNNWDDNNHLAELVLGDTVALDGKTYKGYIRTDYGRVYGGEMSEAGTAEAFRRAYFYNVLEEIDVAGEYYYDYDAAKMYIYLENGADASNLEISLCGDYIIDVSGAANNPIRNVTFKNLDIAYGQAGCVRLQYADGIAFLGCNLSNCSQMGVRMTYSKNVTFRDSKIMNTGAGSFYIRYCENYSKNNIGDAKILIENCYMHNVNDRDYTYAGAFVIHETTGVTVRHCTMSKGSHNAVEIRFVSKCIFEYNEIYDFMTDSDDLGVFYSYMVYDAHFGLVCRNNYIHDCGNTWQTWSTNVFYHDGYGIGYQVENNLIANIGVGNKKAQISLCTVPNAATFNGNVAYNIGGKNMITNEDNYLTSTSQWWRWANGMVLDGETDYNIDVALSNIGFFEGVWDNEAFATDPEINYTYNKLKELTSEEFKKRIFSNAAARFSTVNSHAKDNVVAINDSTISKFVLEVTRGEHIGTYTFDSNTELFDFLCDKFNWRGEDILPTACTLKYDGVAVSRVYFNIYEKNSDGEYVFTKSALRNSGLTEETLTFDYFLQEKQSFIKTQTSNYTAAEILTMGEMNDNLFINCDRIYEIRFTKATGVEYENNAFYNIEGLEMFGDDGNYSLEFEDLAVDIFADYNFLDLSLIGARI